MEIKRIGKINIAHRKGTCDEDVISETFEQNLFLSNIYEYIPKSSDIIIDIGAHIGTFSILVATMATQGHVYALEPCADSYKYLKDNVKLNKLSNVSTHNLALSNKRGKTRLFYDSEEAFWGHSITKSFSALGEDVSTDTLGNFLNDNKIEHCNFCKINCEGAEFDIVLSTPNDILTIFDVILILYHSDLVENYNENDLCNHLGKSNFSIRMFNKDKKRGWIVAVNKKYKPPQIGVFFKWLYYIKKRIINKIRTLLS